MVMHKIVHVFESNISNRAAGWTDVWYVDQADLTAATNAGMAIAQERVKCLHQDFNLQWLRASRNVPVFPKPAARRQRNASLTRVNIDGSLGPKAEADLPGVAAHIRVMNANGSAFRSWLLRGVPDTWWDQDDDKVGKAAVNAFLPGFLAVLTAQSANMLTFVKNPAGYVPVPISKAQYFYMTHRNTGRPFVPFRGRR
jgi:hypothetical protein